MTQKEADRINSIIAAKLMGWTVYPHEDGGKKYPHLTWHGGSQGFRWLLWRGADQHGVRWNPTRSPARAKEVKKKLQERFTVVLSGWRNHQYFCELYRHNSEDHNPDVFVEADTEELAICLAAMRVVG